MPGINNFFAMPIGARPDDLALGEIDGSPIYTAPNGVRYYEQYQPPMPMAPNMALTTDMDPQGRAIHDRVEYTPPTAGTDSFFGPIVSEVARGLTAPGRAARGEPVTYGDAWTTALDYGAMSAPTSAPEGALRMGVMRDKTGAPMSADDINRLIDEAREQYEYLGLRTVDEGYDPLVNSRLWDDGTRLDEVLDGVSVTDVNEPTALAQHGLAPRDFRAGYYPGEDTYLIGGNSASRGEDVGEFLMRDPQRISGMDDAPEGALRSGGIKAYHGSPHDFDKFSMDKIGTGEGAQAYGHGLYFAESEDVARGYRDSLAQRIDVDGKPLVVNNRRVGSTGDPDIDDLLSAHNGDLDAAIASEKAFADEMEAAGKTSRRYGGDPRTGQRKLEALRGRVNSENTGRMYEVNINANPDDFLDWDAPLSEQPEAMRQLVIDRSRTEALAEAEKLDAKGFHETAALYREAADNPNPFKGKYGGHKGGDLVQSTLYGTNPNAISTDELRNAGIPGIKYQDGFSRGAEGGTRNFVVFDEELVSIVRKYGIAGAATYLGMSEDEIRNRVGEM